MSPTNHNRWVKNNIEKILIPALQDMGFEWEKQGSAKEVGREIVLGWPFGSMRRRRDSQIDIVEITMRKRDRSFFQLTIGSCPVEGARDYLHGKHYAASDIHPGYLEEFWTMYDCPRFHSDFGFRFKSFRHIEEADYKKLMKRIVGYLPEIEDVLNSGTIGPHIRLIRMGRWYEQ